ncbi:MAG TPA: SDR family oxidoreductase [Planctomycetota bacterium]|nr:SDR family oxidoreductase [Planctomycetota bacterium]
MLKGEWALVLGASSGFGEATALELGRRGMNVAGVHLDRKNTMPHVEEIVAGIRKAGGRAEFYNANAADEGKRKEILDTLGPLLAGKQIRVVLHSLAFGALKPFFAAKEEERITKSQLEMTVDVMAHSLVYWTQDLVARKMIGKGSRIFAMTSAGGARMWTSYGAVSAAKAALESHIRQIAVELAPQGIAANAIRAGVTDTPSLRKIPGHEEMITMATSRNPGKRLTTPEDVAKVVATLSGEGIEWMTSNVISVDGGEFVT